MITKELKKHVRREAEALRKHATKEELKNIILDELDPDKVRKCIYGLMTGHCFSDRATELLEKCAIPVFVTPKHNNNHRVPERDFREIEAGSFEGRRKVVVYPLGVAINADFSMSAIEVYILQEGAQNEALVSYLRGESEALKI